MKTLGEFQSQERGNAKYQRQVRGWHEQDKKDDCCSQDISWIVVTCTVMDQTERVAELLGNAMSSVLVGLILSCSLGI